MRIQRKKLTALTSVVLVLTASIAVAGVTYEYDKLNRLRRVTYNDGSAIVFEYDEAGNRTLCVTNGDAAVTYLSVYVTPIDWGGVTRAPDLTWYPTGSQVTLVPQVSPARFGGWLGDVPTGHENDNPLTLTMDGSKSVALQVLFALGDLDSDGDVDLTDFGKFAISTAGPGVTTPPPGADPIEFGNADLDRDGDVDLLDFSGLQVWYSRR